MKKTKFITLKNNFFIFKTLYKLHPKFVIFTTLLNIVNITFSMLYSTYFLGFFVQNIVDRKPIENIIDNNIIELDKITESSKDEVSNPLTGESG